MTVRTAEDKGTKHNPDFMTVAHKLQALFDQVRKISSAHPLSFPFLSIFVL